MLLIADSGSTKTHWRFLDGDRIEQYETVGLNPYFSDEGLIKSVIQPVVERDPNVKDMYFYGAGCAVQKAPQGKCFCELSYRIFLFLQMFYIVVSQQKYARKDNA